MILTIAQLLPDLISKVEPENPNVEVDFEIFARTVALILEDNNRLPDTELDRLAEEIEEDVN